MILFEYFKKRRELKRLKKEVTENTSLILNQPIMKELIVRLTNESPIFFKKITNIGVSVGTVGAAIVATPVSIIAWPATVLVIAGYMAAIGYVAAFISKTTVEDRSVLQDKK